MSVSIRQSGKVSLETTKSAAKNALGNMTLVRDRFKMDFHAHFALPCGVYVLSLRDLVWYSGVHRSTQDS